MHHVSVQHEKADQHIQSELRSANTLYFFESNGATTCVSFLKKARLAYVQDSPILEEKGSATCVEPHSIRISRGVATVKGLYDEFYIGIGGNLPLLEAARKFGTKW